VRIISKAAIMEFSVKRPEAVEPLMCWYHITKRAAWRNISEVQLDFPHADGVGAFTVFNISGNKCRLITVVKYRWQVVYIRAILTHSEYARGRWKQ
jgi:mRNA interferase HigB